MAGRARSTRIVHLTNAADSQSIPWEVGLQLARRDDDVLPVAFYSRSSFPPGATAGAVNLGCTSPWHPAGLLRLWRLLHRERPQLIHVHHTASSLWAAVMGRVSGCRHVVKTEHNDHRFQPLHQRLANLILFALADRVICNSRCTLESFTSLERLLARGRTCIVHNGVDGAAIARHRGARSDVRRALGVGEEQTVIGCAARCVPQKNLVRLIEAFALAQPRFDRPVCLVVLGDGPLRPRLLELVEERFLNHHVVLPGAVSREEVYRHLHAFDRYVMPSLWEGFCNAAVEAVIAGLPLLAADIATLREVLGDHALYADPKSPSALARGLVALVESPGTARRLADAQDAMMRRYALERVCGDHLRLYAELLTGRHSADTHRR